MHRSGYIIACHGLLTSGGAGHFGRIDFPDGTVITEQPVALGFDVVKLDLEIAAGARRSRFAHISR